MAYELEMRQFILTNKASHTVGTNEKMHGKIVD